MNPFPNPNPNQLDPFLLHPSIPYLENPNPTFTSLPFVDYVASPLPPLLPTYNNNFTYGDTINNLAFPYPVPGNPLTLVKGEDGVGIGIGLNLGQRTYFNNTRSLFGFGAYGSGQNPQRCQVDGCKTDLTGAKHYHRRHKVCEFHSKAPMVLIGGLQERFCQQCSRFHVVAEFDEAKRSCRKRLADHNRRRRKPVPQLPNSKDPTPPHASHNKINSSTTSTTASASNKPTNDTSSITNNSTTSMSSTSCNLEGSHAKIQSEVQALEKLDGTTTTLSLGEVAKFNSEYPNHNLDIFHEQNQGALSFASTLIEEKQALFHHHHTIFGSSSSSSSNKGHALFEVDFMQ